MWPMSHALYPGLNNNDRPRTAASHRTWHTAESHKTWYGNHRASYASTGRTCVSDVDLGDLIQRSNDMLSALSQSDISDNGDTASHARQPSVQDEPNTVAHGSELSNPNQGNGPGPHVTVTVDCPSEVGLEVVVPPDLQEQEPPGTCAASQYRPSSDFDLKAVIAPQHAIEDSSERGPAEKPAHDTPNSSSNTSSLTTIEHSGKQHHPEQPELAQPKHGSVGNAAEDLPEENSDGHLSGLPLASVITSLSVAVFLVAMDVNVIATAIPHITGEFRSLDDIGWYGSAFLMAACACQIPYGRVYSLFAAKWVFLSAVVVFMAGSLAAAAANGSGVLIFGRGIQGVGTSGILSGGLIIMSEVVPLRLRPVLSGVVGAMEGIAMISAPIIGGVLTDRLNWRWCFYINLPIGGVVLVVVLVCLRVPKKDHHLAGMSWLGLLHHLDVVGAVALVPPIVCTLLALHYAGNGDSWGDKSTILLFVLAVVLFALFAYTQYLNADVAMLPWRVVKQRSVLACFWFILCVSSALVVITYFLPLWFQTIKDTSAQQSGIAIIPMLVAVIVGVFGSGALVSAVGYYAPLMLASSALMPVGLGLLSSIDPDTSRAALLAYPAIFGLGVGVGFQQPLMAVQTVLPQADIAAGTSIIVFGQTFGAAIIIAAGESVFQQRLVSHISTDLGLATVDAPQLLGSGPSSLTALVNQDQVPVLIRAVSRAITDTFYLALAMAALSVVSCVFVEWKSVKKAKKATEKA